MKIEAIDQKKIELDDFKKLLDEKGYTFISEPEPKLTETLQFK